MSPPQSNRRKNEAEQASDQSGPPLIKLKRSTAQIVLPDIAIVDTPPIKIGVPDDIPEHHMLWQQWWSKLIIIGVALLLAVIAYKTWRHSQFAHLRSNFENAIAAQDYTNALNIASSITNRYKPAQDFLGYDKARKAFESVFAQADVDLLKRYNLKTWQTIISLKQQGETEIQFPNRGIFSYETALLLLINLQHHASNIVYKAAD